jgi:3-hydroxyacyl-CoA dehydrogenase
MTPKSLKMVAVIGNGIIGHGIVQIFAMADRQVIMIGRNKASLAKAMKKIAASLGDPSHAVLGQDKTECAGCRDELIPGAGECAAATYHLI